MHEEHIDQLSLSSLSQVITMLKGLKQKHENKEQGKIQHDTPVVKTTKPHKLGITSGPPP